MLDRIVQLPNGAHFYRADLHNHTPADPAFHCGGWPVNTEEHKRTFAREYVRFAKEEQHLDIMAITDHNDVSWLPYIQEAAKEVGLVVFPGVELSALGGRKSVHILAIFDPQTDIQEVDHWLSLLGLMPQQRFHSDGTPCIVQKSPADLIMCIHSSCFKSNLKPIAIAAHAFGNNGILGNKSIEGEARAIAYKCPYLWAIEIPGTREELSEFGRNVVCGQLEAYGFKPVACLNNSDGRGLNEVDEDRLAVGARSTRIKLSNFTTEALRQAFLDHDSRIRLESEWREEKYPRILGMVIEGGFLSGGSSDKDEVSDEPFMLHFNPNLNTIIGGRGVGKSALIEAIRYAFDMPPRTEANKQQADLLLARTLGPRAKVTIFYELADQTRYRIERTFGQLPRVYEVDSDVEKDVQPAQILPGGNPIEVYGQKEVYEISHNLAFQLELLDHYIAEELRTIQAEENEILRQLQTNAEDILRLQRDVEDSQQRLQELGAIQLELERFEKQAVISRLERKTQYDREKTLLDAAAQAVDQLCRDLEQFNREHPPLANALLGENVRSGLPHPDLLEAHADLLSRVDAVVSAALTELGQRLQTIWAEGEADRAAWQKEYDQEEETYQSLLREIPDASADRYLKQQARYNTLQKLAGEVEKRRLRIAELQDERQAKLANLREAREKASLIRQNKAQQLTGQLGGAVQVKVVLAGNREAYAEELTRLFTGTRLQRETIRQMAHSRLSDDTFADPMHLAAAIRAERTNSAEADSILAQIYHLSSAFRARLAALDDELLFGLETYRVPDRPDIRLKVGTQYRPLNPERGEAGLSTGQKCTAILSLILVEHNRPLIIDQPEDDLDNQFIFDEIVTTLRREKERRQFIIATHNANIPVSGDAELIIVLEADERHGWCAHCGSIDDPAIRGPVEDILEGGREAFKIRQAKYGI